jgi:GalNAc-alpha-(1->4)-GalNAc-alpha-(1->3)-diNAcBac-PP-undecaprenol alpha-1,4-N-acetyl-D-galactosaminyltransferase
VEPRRVTFVISQLGPGGAERVMTTLASHWADRGWDVRLITFDVPGERPFFDLSPAVILVPLGLRRYSHRPWEAVLNNLWRVRTLRKAILTGRPDVVVSFIDQANILTLLAIVGTRIPVIVEEHGDPHEVYLGRHWRVLRRITYRRATCVVALTQTSLDFFPPEIRRRGRVIPNPVVAPASRTTAGRTTQGGRIVAMGRLSPEKGFDLLLSAFAAVAPAFPDWSLEIWGEGPLRAELEQQAVRLGLDGRVSLPGLTTRPYDVFSTASLFVLSSRHEGFSNVLCEAMAAGVAVISFDCPSGPRQIIEPDVDGILVPPEDVPALAAAMYRLMRDDRQRRKLSDRATAIRHRFSLERVVREWEALMAAVVRRTTP